MPTNKIIIIFLCLAVLVIAFVAIKLWPSKTPAINSFEDCAKAGYPILESYPPQCKTPDGQTFTGKAMVTLPPDGKSLAPRPKNDLRMCVQVITPAKNPETGEIREFPTPCDVPPGWTPLQQASFPE
ncbi:MAG: hypothetical protein AAB686_01775 [Patescibacteria group bacterium]